MKTKFVMLASMMCFGICNNQSLANFDYTISSVYIDDYFILNNKSLLIEGAGIQEIQANGNSYVEIQNTTTYEWRIGGVGRSLMFDQSSINIYGGETNNVTTKDNSNLNLFGGELDSLIITDNSSAVLYGGNIGLIRNSQFVTIGTIIDLEIVCKSWTWNESANYITGIWGDDSLFNIQLTDTLWENFETYKMIDHISFTVIPEPFTATLMVMGAIVFSRKRR